MHATAITNADLFFKTYLRDVPASTKVVEIGSQDINGSLRQLCPSSVQYVGVDFVAGKGVDIVLTDPYHLPFENESVDVVVSSSVFEHSEMFWLLFSDVMRILKPRGLFYLNVPSNGDYHQYPVDCWRFYPDSGRALVAWARRCGFNAELLESFVSAQWQDSWNDFVAVFLKDAARAEAYPRRMLDAKKDFFNGRLRGEPKILRHNGRTEDMMKLDFAMGLCGMKAMRSRYRIAKFMLGIWRD